MDDFAEIDHITDADVSRCKARIIEPGASYMVTRSCYEGSFFWHPQKHMRLMYDSRRRRNRKLAKVDVFPLIRNTQGYLLGLGAQRYAMSVHNYAYMSNHNHHAVQDRCGLMPAFYQWHNSLLARTTNRYRGRPALTSVLAPGSYDATQTTCKESALHMLAYLAIQPVRHGAVHDADQWPGLRRQTARLFEPEIFYRDDRFFFRRESHFIETFEEASRAQQIAYLEALAELERQQTLDRLAAHLKKLPAGTCIGIDPFASPDMKAQQRAQQTPYTTLEMPVETLADGTPLLMMAHCRDGFKKLLAASARHADREGTVTVSLPTEAMKRIAKDVGKALKARPLPPAVVLKPEKHPLWADVSDAEYLAAIEQKSRELIAGYNARRTRPILGMKKVRAMYSWTSKGPHRQRRRRPVSTHGDGSERLVDETQIRPRFTTRGVARYQELCRRLKRRKRKYLGSLWAFEQGQRDVVFPFGTYLMMVRFHVKCTAPPT